MPRTMSSLPQPLPPVPVQPIAYPPPEAQRPGLITAIGVVSIIVGSLGLLFNGIGGLQAFAVMMMSNMSKQLVTQQAAASTAAKAPKPVDPLSMPKDERQIVLRGLAMHRAITPARRDQLDALLAKNGRQIFRLQGPNLTVDVVKQNVSDSGRLPDARGGEGPDFFVVGEGRIELADDHAKFVPGDAGGGSAETVRVNAADTAEQADWELGLTPAQVKAIVDTVEKQSGTTLPQAQKTKLAAILSNSTQGFFTPAATIPEVTSQVQSVSVFGTGGTTQLTLTTNQGMLSLDATGNTTSSTTWAAGGGVAFGGPGGAPFNIDTTAAGFAIGSAVIGACLAVYLLVIGILVLRQHPRGGRLHKIYAWIKIPLAIVAGIAWVMLWASLFSGGGAAARSMTPAVITGAVVAVLVGCLYPVALLIALRTKSVREYYAAVT